VISGFVGYHITRKREREREGEKRKHKASETVNKKLKIPYHSAK